MPESPRMPAHAAGAYKIKCCMNFIGFYNECSIALLRLRLAQYTPPTHAAGAA